MSSRLRTKREFMANHNENALPMHLQRKVHQGGSGHFVQLPKKGEQDLGVLTTSLLYCHEYRSVLGLTVPVPIQLYHQSLAS
jgi:hypothetical protein